VTSFAPSRKVKGQILTKALMLLLRALSGNLLCLVLHYFFPKLLSTQQSICALRFLKLCINFWLGVLVWSRDVTSDVRCCEQVMFVLACGRLLQVLQKFSWSNSI
jgi:hypothetical protein